MKRVSTNHPSLRGVSCFDCGDDHNTHGWLDTIDNTFFCDRCHQDRHPSIQQRKETVGRRHWDDYDRRAERSRNITAITGAVVLMGSALTSEDKPNIMIPAFIVALVCSIPYIRHQITK